MSEVILKVEHLSKQFPDTTIAAIRDISLDVQQGEILALTGPSGAGKTTLLRILAGLMLPDNGTVFFQDELVNTYAEELVPGHPEIHLVFQDFKLFPNHTIAENIAYPLRYADRVTQQQRTEELLQLFNLQEFAKKYPRELSGGQQQRVALAKAMAAEPAILLLDEPFSQIDGMLKHEIKQALRQLVNDYDTTLIFVTHDTTDALSFADRIALIRQGQLEQLGTPLETYQNPTNQFVARFFGLCNFLTTSHLPKRFNLANSAQSTACVRPEQCQIVTKPTADFSGQVIQQQFLGNHYLLEVTIPKRKTILVYSTQPYAINQTIHLKIMNIHWLKN